MQKKKGTSWGAIIVVSIFFFPVGIYMALKKLHSEPQNYEKNAKAVSIYAWVWIAMGLFYFVSCCTGSTEEGVVDVGSGISGLIIFCAFGIPMLLNANKYKKLVKTYKRYANIISIKGGSIDDIASECGCTYEVALKNIENLIDKGLLYGRVDLASRSYLNNAYNPNPQQNNVYSQPKSNNNFKKVVKCPNCGANNQVDENGGVCEFCGSPIK